MSVTMDEVDYHLRQMRAMNDQEKSMSMVKVSIVGQPNDWIDAMELEVGEWGVGSDGDRFFVRDKHGVTCINGPGWSYHGSSAVSNIKLRRLAPGTKLSVEL